jgi:type VI protein secretion system component Hcp
MMFMSIPGVTGESSVAGFEGKIVLRDCDFGFGRLTDPTTRFPTGGLLPQLVHVTKNVDTSTGFLGQASASGALVADPVRIQLTASFQVSELEILLVELSGARAEDLTVGFVDGGGAPSETVAFSYAEMTVVHTRRSAVGAVLGTQTYTCAA